MFQKGQIVIPKPFSLQLDEWLKSKQPKTLEGLIDHFGEKSFAVLFVVLMAIPALPLPTGGVTHIFEIIAMLLALELITGFDRVWLPERWEKRKLPPKLQRATLPYLIKSMRRVEKYSHVRLQPIFSNVIAVRLIGLFVLVFTFFAFVAPPFSGLDTLPALGVVLLSLAMILNDFLLLLSGLIIGSVGIGLVIGAGQLLIRLV